MEVFGANPVDVVVLVVLLVSGLLALVRGFVAEVLSIAGFTIAIFASLYGLPYVQPTMEHYLGEGLVAKGVASGALFIGTLAVCSALTYFISRQIHATHLSAIDRSLGFLFGLLRGSLLVCLLFICVNFIFPPRKDETKPEPNTMQAVIAAARTGPALAAGARVIISLAPNHGLSIEDLTKVDPLKDLIQPQIAPKPVHSDENRGYNGSSRDDLNRLLNANGEADAPDAPPSTP